MDGRIDFGRCFFEFFCPLHIVDQHDDQLEQIQDQSRAICSGNDAEETTTVEAVVQRLAI